MLRLTIILVLGWSTLVSGWSQTISCPPLTVFCQDLNTAFMPDTCMVEVWAKDFVSKINKGELPLDSFGISFERNESVMNRVFRAEDGAFFEDIRIWVTTNCDTTSCLVNLKINDNDPINPCIIPCPFDPNPWCGYAVVTCSAQGGASGGTIIDVRKNSRAPRGDDWANPATGTDTARFINVPGWRLNGTGQIFGTALNRTTGEIFVAATDVYAYDFQNFQPTTGFPPPTCVGPGGAAGIYRTRFSNVNQLDTIIRTRPN